MESLHGEDVYPLQNCSPPWHVVPAIPGPMGMDERVVRLTVLKVSERSGRIRSDDRFADLRAWSFTVMVRKAMWRGHEGSFKSRLVRKILVVVLGETERQLIEDRAFKDLTMKRETFTIQMQKAECLSHSSYTHLITLNSICFTSER